MRILANENFPGDAVAALRLHGHDVVWARDAAPGSRDRDVLEWARADDRILITFDKDFGELAFQARLPFSSGIILFRISAPSAAHVARVAVAALDSRTEVRNRLLGLDPQDRSGRDFTVGLYPMLLGETC